MPELQTFLTGEALNHPRYMDVKESQDHNVPCMFCLPLFTLYFPCIPASLSRPQPCSHHVHDIRASLE